MWNIDHTNNDDNDQQKVDKLDQCGKMWWSIANQLTSNLTLEAASEAEVAIYSGRAFKVLNDRTRLIEHQVVPITISHPA